MPLAEDGWLLMARQTGEDAEEAAPGETRQGNVVHAVC